MKFIIFALLPFAAALQGGYLSHLAQNSVATSGAALQGDYLSHLSQNRAPTGGCGGSVPGGFVPGQPVDITHAPAAKPVGGAPLAFFPDPARTPSNPLASHQSRVTEDAPDCTKPPQVSLLNKLTYERLNGAKGEGYLYPDPANTPSNPLSARQGQVTTNAPDCTKPPQVSTLNKGTYEMLNGAKGEGYLYPDPANTPSNPLSARQGQVTTNAPDCTKPPQVSTLNKGTYERLNGYGHPLVISKENPFASN